MATLQQLETALVNAHKAGDTDAARKLAAAIVSARGESANQIPSAQVPETMPQKESGVIDQVVGAGETALTLATGATTGALGGIRGLIGGVIDQVRQGKLGTPEAVREIERGMTAGAEQFTYAPRTEAGQSQVQALGEAAQQLIPITPLTGQLAQLGQAAKVAAPAAGIVGQRAAQIGQQTAQRAAAPIVGAVERVQEMVSPTGAPKRKAGGSVGAAGTDVDLMRVTTAESLPVPFTGESGMTRGQASRNRDQLNFEIETSKRADVGAPLRERVENQSAVLNQNFEVLIDRAQPFTTELRDIGESVDAALKNKMGVANRKISQAYKAADEAGETMAPVEMTPLATALKDVRDKFGVTNPQFVDALDDAAQRAGAVVIDENGSLLVREIPLRKTEELIQSINDITNWGDRRESRMARTIKEAIDASTENAGGELYQKARRLRREYAQEFENVGLTKKLTTTKRDTDERQIAVDDVFDRIILRAPLEEMNKVRRTLINAGPDGKQAWQDLKAAGIEHIRKSSQSASVTDSRGLPIMSADKLSKTIQKLDKQGKLESLYGKKQAQIIRDLGEMARLIYTAPPGTVNTSGTASAIITAIDTMATFGVSGIPVPAVKVLQEASKYIKNRELKARINEALAPVR